MPVGHTGPAESLTRAVRPSVTCGGGPRWLRLPARLSAGGLPLDSPEFGPVREALDARSAVVFIHPRYDAPHGHGEWGLRVGARPRRPTEVGVAPCRLVAARIPLRYPRVRLVTAVTGGTIPLLAQHWDAVPARDPTRAVRGTRLRHAALAALPVRHQPSGRPSDLRRRTGFGRRRPTGAGKQQPPCPLPERSTSSRPRCC